LNIVTREKYNITTTTKFLYGNQQSPKMYDRNMEGTTVSKTFKTDLATTSTFQTPGKNIQQHLYLLPHDCDATIYHAFGNNIQNQFVTSIVELPYNPGACPCNMNLIKLQYKPLVYVDYNNVQHKNVMINDKGTVHFNAQPRNYISK